MRSVAQTFGISAHNCPGEVVESEDNHFLEPSTYIDPLAIPEACARDAPLLQAASINAIRVYSVDSSLNHDACMKTFSDAGIYTMCAPCILADLATHS